MFWINYVVHGLLHSELIYEYEGLTQKPKKKILTCIRFAVEWYMRAIVVGARVVKRAPAAAYVLYKTGLKAGLSAFPHPCDPATTKTWVNFMNSTLLKYKLGLGCLL